MSAKEMFEELGYEFNDYSNENNKEDELYAVYVYDYVNITKVNKNNDVKIYRINKR